MQKLPYQRASFPDYPFRNTAGMAYYPSSLLATYARTGHPLREVSIGGQVYLYWGLPPDFHPGFWPSSSNFVGNWSTDSNGAVSGSFEVPSNASAGEYEVFALDTSSAGAYGTASFTVTGGTSTPTSITPTPTPLRMPPTITLQPAQGGVYSKTGFTLLHFAPNTDVNIIFPSSKATWVTDAHTGPDGTSRGFMKVPYTKPGPYTVAATDSAGDCATTPFTVIPTPETVIITSYYGTEVSVKHAGSSEWIELTDPTSYVWQEGDTIATVTNTVIQLALGTHGVASLEPDSELFVSSISESDVTFSVKGNFYQNTDDTVTVQTINGVQIVTDSSSNQVIQSKVGDPQFIITATNTSALIQVYEGVVTLNDSSGNLVPIRAGYQLDVTMGQNSASPEPMNDVTPPSVASVFPVSYEPSINESMPISVTFSKAIDPNSATGSNFTMTDSKGASVNGIWTVLYQTVIFTPQSSLPVGTYVVNVKGGSQGVRDLSGNALLSDYTFTFTGGSANPLAIDFGSTAFILLVVAVVVVTISAVALVARKLTRTRSVSKSTNQVEKQSTGYG